MPAVTAPDDPNQRKFVFWVRNIEHQVRFGRQSFKLGQDDGRHFIRETRHTEGL